MIARVVKLFARATLLLAISVAGAGLASAQDLRWSEQKTSAGEKSIRMENDRLEMVVLPEQGGRIVVFADKATPPTIWVDPLTLSMIASSIISDE